MNIVYIKYSHYIELWTTDYMMFSGTLVSYAADEIRRLYPLFFGFVTHIWICYLK